MTQKTTVIASLLSLCISVSSFGQEVKKSNVHIGFAYPISSNGVNAGDYTNSFSLHAITGLSNSETAFCASGVASIIKDSARGFVGSGFANIIGNKATGLQAAGFINFTRNESKGLQAAGFINISGDVNGAQTAGFANVGKHVNGAQIAGFTNTAISANAQVAGFINVSSCNTAQVAGFINVAKDTRAQVAGFNNVAKNASVQIAGFNNVADSVCAAQVAGFANVAKTVDGAQVAGFINVAKKVRGTQIGFINIADSSNCSIGIINIIGNGEKAIGAMVDETLTTFVTFRSGTKRVYGILALGFNGTEYRAIYAGQAGIGVRIPVSKTFRIAAEITNTTYTDFRRDADMTSGIRLTPSLKFGRFEVFAGPSFNYAMTLGHNKTVPFDRNPIWTEETHTHIHEMYIGGAAGVQVHF